MDNNDIEAWKLATAAISTIASLIGIYNFTSSILEESEEKHSDHIGSRLNERSIPFPSRSRRLHSEQLSENRDRNMD